MNYCTAAIRIVLHTGIQTECRWPSIMATEANEWYISQFLLFQLTLGMLKALLKMKRTQCHAIYFA